MSLATVLQRLNAAKTAIASAITAKGGTVGAGDGLADFPAAIAGIPSGGSAVRTKPWRPPDMPDITSLAATAPTKTEWWATVDTTLGTVLNVRNLLGYSSDGKYVAVGNIENGAFVPYRTYDSFAEYSSTVDVELDLSKGRFQVVHIVCNDDAGTNAGLNIFEPYQPIVELLVCGQLYNFVASYRNICRSSNLRYLTVSTKYSRGGTGYQFKSNSLTNIDLSNAEISGYGGFNIPCLQAVEFPSTKQSSASISSISVDGCAALQSYDLSWADVSSLTNINNAFRGCWCLETLNLSGCDFSGVTSASSLFSQTLALKNIITDGLTKLPPVNIVIGGTYQNVDYGDKLTDASLVNVANALVTGAHTITFHATTKARLDTIMGTVSGGVFTASASGDTSLEDFITLTKGWTIA